MIQSHFQGNHKTFPSWKTLQKGAVLFSQGDEFKGYYLIKSGLLKTSRTHETGGKSLLSIKSQGEFIGEYQSDLVSKFHSYTAIVLDDNTLVEMIPWEDEGTLKLQKILASLQDELQYARTRLERLLFRDAEQRIKLVLKDLGIRLGRKFGDETLLKLPLTHEDLAVLADTSRQTVSTVLSGLKTQKKINYSRGRILFRNIDNF